MMVPVEDLGGLIDVFAKTGGPAVVTLVVVGYLVWKALSPLMLKLLSSLDELSQNLKDMTKEISATNTEIRAMGIRLDQLEREVRDPRHRGPWETGDQSNSAPRA